MVSLNDLDIRSDNNKNLYLTGTLREKVCTIGGKEFGLNEGKSFKITKEVYGLKSPGSAFRSQFSRNWAIYVSYINKSDTDVWMRPEDAPESEEYYEYIPVYVNDILCISYDQMRRMKDVS